MGAYLTPPTEPQSVHNRNETGGPGEPAHLEDSAEQMRASGPDGRLDRNEFCAAVALALLGIVAFIAAALGFDVVRTMLEPDRRPPGMFSVMTHRWAKVQFMFLQVPITVIGIALAITGLWLKHFRVPFVVGLVFLVVCSVVTLLSFVPA